MSGKPLYYLDSPLFIAWLTDEPRPAGDMEGLTDVIRKFDSDKLNLMTSTLTRLEVLEAGVGEIAIVKFREFLDEKPNILEVAIDPTIIDVAYEIRNYYKQSPDYKKTVSVADSIHLASAIIHKAVEFQTFDAENRRDSLGLIPLSENVAGTYGIKIVKPTAKQIDAFVGR